MKHIIAVFLSIFLSAFASAQDSSKVITQEVGFNTVSLIKQLISNNPSSVLPQLPYDVFYNIYYKDKIGIRLGLGINNAHTETNIEGQQAPKTSDNNNLNFRAGVSYNIVRSRKITINGFVDFIKERNKIESATTTTAQSFPNPVQILTVQSTDKTSGIGAQVGMGVKYNIYRHLSIYAEVPFTYLTEKLTSTVNINDSGDINETTTTVKNRTMHITLPTTIYLVLRF